MKFENNKKLVSMTRNCHNLTLQTNPPHHEEETLISSAQQNKNQTQNSNKTIGLTMNNISTTTEPLP